MLNCNTTSRLLYWVHSFRCDHSVNNKMWYVEPSHRLILACSQSSRNSIIFSEKKLLRSNFTCMFQYSYTYTLNTFVCFVLYEVFSSSFTFFVSFSLPLSIFVLLFALPFVIKWLVTTQLNARIYNFVWSYSIQLWAIYSMSLDVY